jgi:hypothetical protein
MKNKIESSLSVSLKFLPVFAYEKHFSQNLGWETDKLKNLFFDNSKFK